MARREQKKRIRKKTGAKAGGRIRKKAGGRTGAKTGGRTPLQAGSGTKSG